MTGIADAFMDSTPVVCLAGQVDSSLLGTDSFQEIDIIAITQPITKWNCQINNPDDIPATIEIAYRIAQSGRPGPVLISITKDAQHKSTTLTNRIRPSRSQSSYQANVSADRTLLQQAAALVNTAKMPYILAGQGVLLAKATEELRALAEKAGIPVATTLLGQSAFPCDHRLYTGWVGMHGTYGSNMLTTHCDVLLAVGMRFDERVTGDPASFAQQAKVIHIDIDAAEINKVVKADMPLVGDARLILQGLTPLLERQDRTSWRDSFDRFDQLEQEKVTTRELAAITQKPTMAEVIHLLSEKTCGDAILVTDVGQHQMKASRYYRFRRPYSLVTSGGFGTMGFALPASIGAKVGAPDRDVIAIIGDGGFQMTLKELATLAHYQWPIKIILLNNNYLGMVRQWQQLFFDRRYSFVHLQNPDFMTIAKGFGINSQQCSQRSLLSSSLDALLHSQKPYLLEVIVEQEENVFPIFPAGGTMDQIRLE